MKNADGAISDLLIPVNNDVFSFLIDGFESWQVPYKKLRYRVLGPEN